MDLTNELLELSPNHERAFGNKAYYEKELAKEVEDKADKMLRGDDGSPGLETEMASDAASAAVYTSYERQMYEKLCRGEVKPEPQLLAKLKCRYVTEKSPFLTIAPLKLEEASLNPYIVVYHDVIYDDEIELIKRMAKPRVSIEQKHKLISILKQCNNRVLFLWTIQFRRATVQNHKTGELEVANYRISKSAWLRDEEHEKIRNIGLRVEDMTGLTIETAEELQVVNYGIGGHYEPHFDFARREETNAFKSLGTGNRIATVLFYVRFLKTNFLIQLFQNLKCFFIRFL